MNIKNKTVTILYRRKEIKETNRIEKICVIFIEEKEKT
jgi:hypothetical protein